MVINLIIHQFVNLGTKNNNILNSELFLKNCIQHFLHSFKVEKDKIILKIFDQKENNFTFKYKKINSRYKFSSIN